MTSRARTVFSMRWIVAGSAAVLVTIAVLGATAVTERRTRGVLVRETEARLLLQARNLAVTSTGALLTEFPELTLAPLLTEMQAQQPELGLLVVMDRSGTIQGHTDVWRIGTRYVAPGDLTRFPTSVTPGAGESLTGNASMLVASAPILDNRGEVLGKAFVGLRRSHVEEALAEIGKRQLLVLGGLLAVAVVCSFWLMSLLLRPIGALRAGIERIGRGELDAPIRLADQTEFGLLAGAVNDMAADLRAAQAEMVERGRLAHEMDLAQEVQRALLPGKPTAAGEFVVVGQQWAAAEVGGDFYDVQTLPDGTIALTIADVAGKGLAGCMVASMLFSLVRALRPFHESPKALLICLDERLSEILRRGTFVTMFYGLLDPTTGRLTYASAGHNPALLYRAQERRVEWHGSKGIPLGAIRGGAIAMTLEDFVLELGPGDLLLQSTDGINEAAAPGTDKEFGFEGMEKTALQFAPLGAREMVDRLHQAVDDWRGGRLPMDDETVLIVSREGAAERSSAARQNGAPVVPGDAEALRRFEAAWKHGVCLDLSASLDALSAIQEWLVGSGAVASLTDESASMLNLALYEVCANIAEHGYGQDATKSFQILWVPSSLRPGGSFVVRDHGRPFRPEGPKRADLNDPETRKRGRGLGLEIIHLTMRLVQYNPGTEVGNLTILDWNPETVANVQFGAQLPMNPFKGGPP
jgi:serine phosphatase RsbU (regulator of sigma subunit)/anti-sigma regulatory factor (Ser/Thr protein kinase)